MGTTKDFVHNLNSDNIPHIVTNYFDEIMVLYNLVGSRQDIEICTDSSNDTVKFILLMDCEESATELYNSLNNTEFSVYSDRFIIGMTLSGSSITTTIIKI